MLKGEGFLGFLVAWFDGLLASWFLVSWFLYLSVSKFLGLFGSKLIGFEVSWFQSFLVSWFLKIQCFNANILLEFAFMMSGRY